MILTGRKALLATMVVTWLAFLALPATAHEYVPEEAGYVESARDLSPVWIFRDAAGAVDDLEKFVIEDNDVRGYRRGMEEIEMLFRGEKYPDGTLELSRVITYRAIQAAISRLWPEDVPAKEDFEVVTADPSSSTRGVFEYMTGAVSRRAFELEIPPGTGTGNLTPGNYAYRFTNSDTGEELRTRVLEEVWSGGFFELGEKVIAGTATPREQSEYDAMWDEVRGVFLTTGDLDELFFLDEEEEAVPVWPIVFSLGLFGLVAGTTIYSIAKGRVRNEY